METHGTYHLADNAKQFEVQRSNNFEFIVSFDKAMKRAGYNSEVAETIDARQAQEVLRLSVVSASAPSFLQSGSNHNQERKLSNHVSWSSFILKWFSQSK